MERYIKTNVIKDLIKKMVFVGGPRQVGKTHFAKEILRSHRSPEEFSGKHYLNWDDTHDRELIIAQNLPAEPGLLVLDEIHKYKKWRDLLKGLFDKRREELRILVTGSAQLDYYRKGGDSLQGRYHYYRMHPLSLKELAAEKSSDLVALLTYGGFPEPFYAASEVETRRWSREYRSRIIRDELRDLERIHDISLIEELAHRLPELVGSPLSLNSLREDLQVSHQTVVRWMLALERLYHIFRVYPFGATHIRAVKKEAKHYHYDWTQIKDEGLRFENLVACHLLKWCHFQEDTQGLEMELRYFRDTDKREVDFVILQERKPILFVEGKLSAQDVSSHLLYLVRKFPTVPAFQIHLHGNKDVKTPEGIRLQPAFQFLRELV